MSGRKLVVLVLVLLGFMQCMLSSAEARTVVGDDLRHVVDSEEDEEWKAWGGELEDQMGGSADLAGEGSPQLVFAQLKPKAARTEKDQAKLAHRFRAYLRLGGYEESVFAVTEDRLLISIRRADDLAEYIELITKQEDVLWFEVHNKRFTWDEDEDRMKFIGDTETDAFARPDLEAIEKNKGKKKKKKGKKKGKKKKSKKTQDSSAAKDDL